MAWTVRVQTEAGEPVDKDFDIGFEAIPSGPEYPICSSVARYYMTLLNPPQLEALVSEWDRAAAAPEFSHLSDSRLIRDVAERCALKHLYVRFVGD
jgi:hypothetical protein